MHRLTAEWVQKAEADATAAAALATMPMGLNDIVCFHCQHKAETECT